MISNNILNFILEFNDSISSLTKSISSFSGNLNFKILETKSTTEIEKIFQRKTKLMKKVVTALSEDLVTHLNSSGELRPSSSKIVINKVEDHSPERKSSVVKDPMGETTTSLLRVKTSERLRSSRSKSKNKKIKIQQPPKSVASSQQFENNSQQLQLSKTDFQVSGD